MARKFSIREKLVALYVVLGLVSILVTGYFSYELARSAIISRTFDQLTSLRIEKKRQLEQFFRERERDLMVLIIWMKNHEEKNSEMFPSEISHILDTSICDKLYHVCLINGTPEIEVFGFGADHTGVSSHTDSVIIRIVNSGKSYCMYESLGKDPGLFLGTSFVEDSITNWVILQIPFRAVSSIMYEKNPYNGLGETGETYLVGVDSLMRSASRFQISSILTTRVNTIGVARALNGESRTMIIQDYRKMKVLSSFDIVRYDGLKWAILAEMDWDEVILPAHRIRNNILVAVLLVGVVLIILSYLVSLGITRPLILLTKAASEVGAGNFDVKINIRVSDEIGDLTNSFNLMAEKLKYSNELLQHEQDRRTQYLMDGQDIERQRLSRELHDGLGQKMIGLRMKMEELTYNCDKQQATAAIQTLEIMDSTIEEIRRISNDLMPSVLREFGITNAVRDLCEEVLAKNRISAEFRSSGDLMVLDRKQNLYIFRIIQEAVTNIIKHSEATKVIISTEVSGDVLSVLIADNGKGFNFDGLTYDCHQGILNMKERTQLLGGTFGVESASGNGTNIYIRIPLNL